MRTRILFLAIVLSVVLSGTGAFSACDADLNCDGNVDGSDLAIFAASYGQTGYSPSPRILSGTVSVSNGAILNGTGIYLLEGPSSGCTSGCSYRIGFDVPFNSVPNCVISEDRTSSFESGSDCKLKDWDGSDDWKYRLKVYCGKNITTPAGSAGLSTIFTFICVEP